MTDIKIKYNNKIYYFSTNTRDDHTCEFKTYGHIPGNRGLEPILFCKKDGREHIVKATKKED